MGFGLYVEFWSLDRFCVFWVVVGVLCGFG